MEIQKDRELRTDGLKSQENSVNDVRSGDPHGRELETITGESWGLYLACK